MPNLKDKKCVICGEVFHPRGPAQKYCEFHSAEKAKEVRREIQYRVREKKGLPSRCGKGGSAKKFTENKQFKTGMGNFHRLRTAMREEIKHCERCGKDLTEATRYGWCVHHKDHDRTHNVRENLEMLCKRCHQIEHECWKAVNPE